MPTIEIVKTEPKILKGTDKIGPHQFVTLREAKKLAKL